MHIVPHHIRAMPCHTTHEVRRCSAAENRRGDLEGSQSEADPASPGMACCCWEKPERRGQTGHKTSLGQLGIQLSNGNQVIVCDTALHDAYSSVSRTQCLHWTGQSDSEDFQCRRLSPGASTSSERR